MKCTEIHASRSFDFNQPATKKTDLCIETLKKFTNIKRGRTYLQLCARCLTKQTHVLLAILLNAIIVRFSLRNDLSIQIYSEGNGALTLEKTKLSGKTKARSDAFRFAARHVIEPILLP